MNSSRKQARVSDEFDRERRRLYAILDDDPQHAIEDARRLAFNSSIGKPNIEALKASIFIDGGTCLSDANTISEGIQIFQGLGGPKVPQFAYNIANGLSVLAQIQIRKGATHLETAELRQEVRSLFGQAANECTDITIKSSSLTNLANVLKDSFRWVEAYDSYAAALDHDPTNAVALSGICNLIKWRMRSRVETNSALRRSAMRYLFRARATKQHALRYAGPQAAHRIDELLQDFGIRADTKPPEPEIPPVSPYAAFVRSHRLALCLTPESVGSRRGRWDHVGIKSVSEAMSPEYRVPTLFATWSLLKADFLAARWLAHTAISEDIPETGSYSDTLDYAQYSTKNSILVNAQKAALDVLDKIAVATTDYLKLPGKIHRIYFASRWHVMESKPPYGFKSPLQWQPEIAAEIQSGNRGLIALAELAHDYANGYLRSKKILRNFATHGFIVMHDLGIDRASPSTVIQRYTKEEFRQLVIQSLQVVRAALLYFHEFVSEREHRIDRSFSGKAATMYVPSHHDIRGEASGI